MNEQTFAERVNQAGIVEQPGQDLDNPVVSSDYFVEPAPVLTTLIYETPIAGTLPPGDLQDALLVQEAPMGQTIIYNQDAMGETLVQGVPDNLKTDSAVTLLSHEEAEQFRKHWNEIQGQFVDEPRSAVDQADALVGEVIEKISQLFASEHTTLENQWKQGSEVSTEDLRQTLQHYRAFFNRLVMQIPV